MGGGGGFLGEGLATPDDREGGGGGMGFGALGPALDEFAPRGLMPTVPDGCGLGFFGLVF